MRERFPRRRAFPVCADVDVGPALDVNLLSTPTPRKLFGLWFEAAGQSVTVLPSALDELAPLLRIVVHDGVPVATPPPEPLADYAVVRHQLEWVRQLRPEGNGPYRFAPLTSEQSLAALEIRERFSLACFPILSQREEIPAHRDAMIVSEALACGLDIIITNNMTSIDHFEVNDWLRRHLGRNTGVLVTGDDAMLQAHTSGQASRQLLALALASAWPLDGAELDGPGVFDLLERLCKRLAGGCRMPNVASRLASRLRVDPNPSELAETARRLAATSKVVDCERERLRRVEAA